MTVSYSEGFPSQSTRIRAEDLGVLPAPSLGVGWGPGTLSGPRHSAVWGALPPAASHHKPGLGWAILFFQGWICCPWRWTFHQERPLVPEPKAALLVNLPDAASPGPTLQDSVQNRWLGTSFSQFETLSSSWREAPTIVCGQEPGCGTWLSRAHTSLYKKFP